MSRSKRILCAALACLATWSLAFAEGNVVEPTAAPTEQVTSAPTETPTETPTPEPTEAPSEEATPEPTAEPTATPTAEPTATPEVAPTATPEPTVAPEEEQMEITVAGYELPEDEIYRISVQSAEDQIAFEWQPVEQAVVYQVRVTDSLGGELYLAQQTETGFQLPVADLGTDIYTLTVEAYSGEEMLSDELLLHGSAMFTLAQGGGMFPGGGFPSGGGGFSGGSMGGSAAISGSMPEAQGFRVTPGEALTDSHSSGTKDMQLYGTVLLEASEEAMSVLTLDGDELAISLADQGSFTAAFEEGCLVLTPESDGAAWNVNAFVLKTLCRSGVEVLRLNVGGETVELSTDWSLQGAEYGRLCAQGYVSKDCDLTVTADGVTASVAGKDYTINENNELVGG